MSNRCPTDEQLIGYLIGRTPDEMIPIFEHHLQECTRCPARLAILRVDSQLTRALADSGTASRPVSRGLHDLMDQLITMVPGSRTQGIDQASQDTEIEDGFSFLEKPDHPQELGRLGEYRVLQLIGRGDMGVVFRAVDDRLGREVGLKVLRPKSNRDPLARSRFLQEARAMAALRHDHIALIYQVGEVPSAVAGEPAIAFLAMELLDGLSLQTWMTTHPRPPLALILRIAEQAALGMAVAHAHGLIHRDIKPSNLWLETPADGLENAAPHRPSLEAVGRVKLIDFGLATPIGDEGISASIVGTPIYMAPEQFAGGPPDPRSDLFSLGCVLYELCTGEHPFPARQHGRPFAPDPVPTPAWELNAAVPQSLSRLIGQMLSVTPENRPSSARKLLASLQTITTQYQQRRAKRRLTMMGVGMGILGLGTCVGLMHRFGGTDAPQQLPVPILGVAAHSTDTASHPTTEPQPTIPRPPFPAGVPDAWWWQRLADQRPQEQFRLVSQKLAELNPGYDANLATGWVEPELVIRYTVRSNVVADIRPIRGLLDLKTLTIEGTQPGKGHLVNLAPLRGLKLVNVNLRYNPQLRDLSALQDMDLSRVTLTGTGVDSLVALQGMRIAELNIEDCPIRDLSPIRTMPELRVLRCTGCPIASYRALVGRPIQQLWADVNIGTHQELLQSMPDLQQLNGQKVFPD
ncbi:MAG: protein kinase [Bacteroidales bacterium]|nr:protein kinase [Bacteroidales bacterium]